MQTWDLSGSVERGLPTRRNMQQQHPHGVRRDLAPHDGSSVIQSALSKLTGRLGVVVLSIC